MGWHEYRDDLFRRLVDVLTDEYVESVEIARSYGKIDTSPTFLGTEVKVGSGVLIVQYTPKQGASVDAWGKEELLPLLSEWLSDAMSRYGMRYVTEEAWRRIEESDREARDYEETEDALRYSI